MNESPMIEVVYSDWRFAEGLRLRRASQLFHRHVFCRLSGHRWRMSRVFLDDDHPTTEEVFFCQRNCGAQAYWKPRRYFHGMSRRRVYL